MLRNALRNSKVELPSVLIESARGDVIPLGVRGYALEKYIVFYV